jgi:glucose repression mediator protein
LGTLYESCNQISDSIDAYQKAAELDPTNKHIQQRLNTLRQTLASQNGDIKPPPSKLPIVQEALHPFPITKFI